MTSSWFFLPTLNYDARSTTQHIYKVSLFGSESPKNFYVSVPSSHEFKNSAANCQQLTNSHFRLPITVQSATSQVTCQPPTKSVPPIKLCSFPALTWQAHWCDHHHGGLLGNSVSLCTILCCALSLQHHRASLLTGSKLYLA